MPKSSFMGLLGQPKGVMLTHLPFDALNAVPKFLVFGSKLISNGAGTNLVIQLKFDLNEWRKK